MNAKHQFKYTYSDTNLEEFSPVEVTFDMPGDVTINQMLFNFESYLKACGFYFDGHLEVVAEESYEELNASDELDGTLYEFEDVPQGGCMADFDKECGCETTSSSLENDDEDDGPTFHDTLSTAICENSKWKKEADKKLKEWNEGIAKLDNEQRQKCREEALKMSGLHDEAIKEVTKNKWVHGMCNPPADDAKEYVKDCKSTGKKYNSIDALLKGLMKK
jgi:hypothetical protein